MDIISLWLSVAEVYTGAAMPTSDEKDGSCWRYDDINTAFQSGAAWFLNVDIQTVNPGTSTPLPVVHLGETFDYM